MIVGITGTIGAGKGTVVDILKEKGFTHFSARALLIEEIEKRNLPVNRDSMVLVGNELRSKYGPGYIAEELFSRAQKIGGDCVIESLRTVGEIEALRKKGTFILLAVDADAKIRYERILGRKTVTDDISFEKFKADEEREFANNDSSMQNIGACMKLADYTLDNNTTIDDFKKKTEEIIKLIRGDKMAYQRPSWDEYFMEISDTVAKRATCDRGRSGCVIAKDKQLMVSGYVGSPIGMPHCDDVGHQMKKTVHEDGSESNHCVRTVHAEQNAICQAAKLGIPICGATLYCKMTPCRVCAMLIINSGIKKVVCRKKYHAGGESEEMFKAAGVELVFFSEELEHYEKQ
jgi:dCMP deaminase